MTTEDFKRKLTAILSADVVGYSRLMGDDEESTVRTLNKYKKMIFGLIERHNGRLVDSPGDNLLAEFASVVDAVKCAVQVQKNLKVNNEELPPKRKMEFRIGINTGDVIQDGDRIYGDGVNVAARIESLADPGGIFISRTAYDQVKRKIDMKYDYMGEQQVKNIYEPVRVYKVLMESISDDVMQENRSQELTSEERKAYPLSEKSSIAVLPFANISPEKDQEYFVDGLSEEILNSLVQIPDLTVIARTSSFSFKGTNKTIQEIASVLRVNNILEGSVRKAGNALRITAQLINNGSHLWSKTYDREFKDIFAVQEDIATAVADELKLTLGIGKSLKLLGGTDNLEAYEIFLVAKGQRYRLGFKRALESIDAAIALDPEFAAAWAFKGIVHLFLTLGSAGRVSLELEEGLNAALRAIELEPRLGKAYLSLGGAHTLRGEFIKAEKAYLKGMELTTESSDYFEYGLYYYYAIVGYLKKCNELLGEVRRNDPLQPTIRASYILSLGHLGEVGRAEKEYELGKEIFGDQWRLGNRYITLVRLGTKDVVSRDEIVFSDPIFDMGKEHLDSPKEGLAELRRLYNNDDNLTISKFAEISVWAAYFGEPEFVIDVMEKAMSNHAAGIFYLWFPVMQEVRKTPRFKEFIREIGLVDHWNQFGWPDLCRPVGDDDFECD